MQEQDLQLVLVTHWRRSARGIFRDAAAEQLDLTLAGNLRLVDVWSGAERVLYLDLSRGEYRELRFDDQPDGCGGSACLKAVTVDYVKANYESIPDFVVAEG